MINLRSYRRFVSVPLTLCLLLIVPSILAQGGLSAYQSRNQHFGTSGGNVKDSSRLFCCSGTLGSLVSLGGVSYILSNNHVLARADQAAAGDDISQPGLIDNGCRIPPIVADFTVAPKLGSNVDAALAQLRSGQMDSQGFIEGIGVPSSTVVAPSIGLSVTKSGRTTGTTTGSVSSFNTSVSVQYQAGCGKGKKFTVSYTNQVVITPGSFSAGGDSGSLIVTNNASHNPVALLFAGSSSSTIGNPIGEVLTKVSAALGGGLVSFGGKASSTPASALRISPSGHLVPQLPQEVVDFAIQVKEERVAELMARPSVIGVGVGASETDDRSAAIVIFVDKTTGVAPKLPKRIKGVEVQVVYTDPFVAF
jgi:hypothetical protein